MPAGLTGSFQILSIDTAQKRIGLALVGRRRLARRRLRPRRQDAIAPGTIMTGKVERHEKFGVFVFLSPGRTGLIPNAETGVDRDADMRKAFPVGSEVEVAVLEVDPAGKRIRLSKKAVAELRERAELSDTGQPPTPHPRRRWDPSPISFATLSAGADAQRLAVNRAPCRPVTRYR